MARFIFEIMNEDKRTSTGVLEAADYDTAMRTLAKKYHMVLELREVKYQTSLWQKKVSGEELMITTKELATSLRAGLNLKHALETIAADTENPRMKGILVDISSGVSEGKSLSELLVKYPDVFSSLYIHMVQAGEMGGKLPVILTNLATYIEKAESMKRKVKAATYYPATVIIVSVLISIFIFVFGVKQFEGIYAGLDAKLPALTVFFIQTADVIWQYWYIILLVLAAVSGILAKYFTTEGGILFRDRLLLTLPVIGTLVKRLSIARFARTLGTLYTDGVSIIQSMDLVAGSIGNKVIEGIIRGSLEEIKKGESITKYLRDSNIFTKMSISMIANGEESGTLEVMLDEIANFYEEQVDISLKTMISLIEPFIIIAVGILVGILVVALGLPLMQIINVL